MQPTVSRGTTALVDGCNELCCIVYMNGTKLRAMKVVHITLVIEIMTLLVISSMAYRDDGYPNSKSILYLLAYFKQFSFQGSPALPAATAAATPSATA